MSFFKMSAKAAGRAKVAAGVAVGLGALGGAGYWIITQHPHQPPAPPGYINIKHKVGSNTFGSNKYEQLRVHKSDTKPLDPAKKAGKKTTWVKTTEWRRDEPDADFYAAEEENWLVLRSMLKGDGRKEVWRHPPRPLEEVLKIP